MSCIYILFSKKNKKTYTGSSHEDTPNTRLIAHNSGKTRSTKFGIPWVIIHTETFSSYTEAKKKKFF